MMTKRFWAGLMFSFLAVPAATAQDLSTMFQDAYNWLQPMQSMSSQMTIGLTTSSAQKRVGQIGDLVPDITNALLQSTANPTEEARVKVCQLTSRVNDMFLGIDTLDGFSQLQGSIDGLRTAFTGARGALNCTANQPSFCPAPLKRTMKTTYFDYNGNPVEAEINMEANGTGTGTGTYRLNNGSVGQISNISCFDAGHTLKARWSLHGVSGFLTFYFIDQANKEFLGVYGDESIGRPKFQGFWDGKTVEANTGGAVQDGEYTLRARHSGKCLDVRDHSLDNGARLQQWACTGEAHQTFRVRRVQGDLYSLQGQQSGKCVSAEAVQMENGVPMIQWDCANGPDQLVRFVPSANGSHTVRFSHSGKCMDVANFSSNDGLEVHQWDCSNGADQDWTLVKAGSAPIVTPTPTPGTGAVRPDLRYSLVSRQSGLCLDAVNGGTENGTAFQQYQCFNNGAQSFHFRDVGNGYYNMVNDQSGRCVSAEAVRLENGTKMILWDCNGGPDQKVRLDASVGGTVRVVFQHSNKCMDVDGSSMGNAAKIHQWDCSGKANQDWILRQF